MRGALQRPNLRLKTAPPHKIASGGLPAAKNANGISKRCYPLRRETGKRRGHKKILELAHEYDRTRTGTTPKPGSRPTQEALAAVVLSIGGFSIARATNDDDLSKALLDAARNKALELLK
ncbi:MAG: hypothetical protein CMI60_00550 [Parvibaculum sp.]|nr:hypothetical protein [Parvibaculum sp.]